MKRFVTISFVLMSVFGYSQEPASELWFSAAVPVTFGKTKNWQWHNDAGYRTNGISIMPHQYLYRTGIRKFFSEQWSAATGIAFFSTRVGYKKADHEFGNEYRLWQEINHQYKIFQQLSLQNRLRIEQRFFEAINDKDAYKALRLRYRIGLTQKLSSKWSVQVADEYMRQLQQDQFLFNQNRFMFTAQRHWNKDVQVQAGYMWLLRSTSSQHIFTISFQKAITIDGNKNGNR